MKKPDLGSGPFSAIYLLCCVHSTYILLPSILAKLTLILGLYTLVALWFPLPKIQFFEKSLLLPPFP